MIYAGEMAHKLSSGRGVLKNFTNTEVMFKFDDTGNSSQRS